MLIRTFDFDEDKVVTIECDKVWFTTSGDLVYQRDGKTIGRMPIEDLVFDIVDKK